jgi:hypothetical protein
MCQTFETLAMDALLFQGSDQPLHHAVLLRTMGRDELLAQAVTFDQGVLPRSEDEAIVGSNTSQ